MLYKPFNATIGKSPIFSVLDFDVLEYHTVPPIG